MRNEASILHMAQDVLRRFSLHRGCLNPPVPIHEVAEWMGFQVVPLYTVTESFSAVVNIRQKVIGVNGHHANRRQRFSVGHELGHIILRHPAERNCTATEIAAYDREADFCAAELLMPEELVRPLLGSLNGERALANLFDVSEEAMKRKLSQPGFAKEPTVARRC